MVLLNSVPNFSDIGNFILMNLNGWTYLNLSTNFVCFTAIYVVIMFILLNKVKGIRFITYIYMVGVAEALMLLFQFNLLMWKYFNFKVMFLTQIFTNMFSFFSSDVNLIVVLGRITRFLPEGFECTGITTIISIGNIGTISSSLLAAKELDIYSVHNGYYDRLIDPMLINTCVAIVVILVLPVFLRYRLKRNKLMMLELDTQGTTTREDGGFYDNSVFGSSRS